LPRSRTGWRPGGKKAEATAADRLEEALAQFSGYLAVDELRDGPFTVLSLVDNRRFRRLAYCVLEHRPSEAEVRGFLEHFQAALQRHGLHVRGVSTDGSWLYPGPIVQVFGPVPHQLCRFHIMQELTRQALHAVAAVRKHLAASAPQLPRGRVLPANRPLLRRARAIARQVAALFEHRYLFVQQRLSPAQKRTLRRVTRGQPELRRVRQIMDRVYHLFDRRCRSGTARQKLAVLRQQVSCFPDLRHTLKKLFSPQMEQALSFLDDKLLPATSNAVERANRRHRKMQKTIYRVRTGPTLTGRIALDLHREAQAPGRDQATATLHRARAA
jgi:hypothetical protein